MQDPAADALNADGAGETVDLEDAGCADRIDLLTIYAEQALPADLAAWDQDTAHLRTLFQISKHVRDDDQRANEADKAPRLHVNARRLKLRDQHHARAEKRDADEDCSHLPRLPDSPTDLGSLDGSTSEPDLRTALWLPCYLLSEEQAHQKSKHPLLPLPN
jgi:hypothetical protein